MDTGSEFSLISGDSKHSCRPPIRVEAYGNQRVNGIYLRLISELVQWISEFILWLFSQFLSVKFEWTYLSLGRIFTLPDQLCESHHGKQGYEEILENNPFHPSPL